MALMQKVVCPDVMKFFFVFSKPFWHEELKLNGESVFIGGTISAGYDISPKDHSLGILVTFVCGDKVQELLRMSLEVRKLMVMKDVMSYLSEKLVYKYLIDFHEFTFTGDKYTKGCFFSCLTKGMWSEVKDHVWKPCGRIYWAGSETSTAWYGYMEGAVRTGESVAT